jgi:dihydrofolate reductase
MSLDGYIEDAEGTSVIEREFDPEAIRQLQAKAGADLSVGGAALAAQAIKAGLVDEYHLFLVPLVIGGGKRALPDNDLRRNLELLDQRRFRNGTVYLRYGTLPHVSTESNCPRLR